VTNEEELADAVDFPSDGRPGLPKPGSPSYACEGVSSMGIPVPGSGGQPTHTASAIDMLAISSSRLNFLKTAKRKLDSSAEESLE